MSKNAFLSIAYKNLHTFSQEIDTIVNVLNTEHLTSTIFVRDYAFIPGHEKEMMEAALGKIKQCDIFIAEVSTKAIGVGIEIGYAKAL